MFAAGFGHPFDDIAVAYAGRVHLNAPGHAKAARPSAPSIGLLHCLSETDRARFESLAASLSADLSHGVSDAFSNIKSQTQVQPELEELILGSGLVERMLPRQLPSQLADRGDVAR